MPVDEHTTTIDHVPVFYRTAPGGRNAESTARWSTIGTEPPILYLHDALTSSDDLVPFLERTGGLAPDLIGFGRSGKGGHLDYSPEGIVAFLERFLAELGVERASLVGHGWGGALGLLLALGQPELIERLVLINPVPLLEGFTWHRPARLWRQRLVGELVMGSTPRWLLSRELRRGSPSPKAWTQRRLAAVWDQFDQGTQRAMLRLHRAAGEARLAALGDGLGSLTTPTLVIWGDADPWFGREFADAYGGQLPDATIEHVRGAGHWPWLEEPQVIDRVSEFVG